MDGSDTSSTSTTLAYLIQEGQAKDPEVLKALIAEYGGKIYQCAFSLAQGDENYEHKALLLTGETFYRAVRRSQNVHHYDSLNAWLLSELLKLPRSRTKTRKPASGEALVERIRILPDKLRLPLLLRYNQDLPVSEIALVLKTSEHLIHKRLSQCRERLLDSSQARPHSLKEMHAILDGLQRPEDSDFQQHLDSCSACAQFWKELKSMPSRMQSALRPDDASLGSSDIQQILDIAQHGKPEDETPSRTSLPLKELVWMAMAVVGFLLIFQGLSPLWTQVPTTPGRPTPAPSQQLNVQFRQVSYENLISVLVENPPPNWVQVDRLAGESTPTTGIEFSADGRYAAYGKEDRLILLDLFTSIRTNLGSPDGVTTALAFSGGGRHRLATGDEFGNLRIWTVDTFSLLYSINNFPGPVHSLEFSPNGEYLAAGGNRGIWVYEIKGNSLIRVMDLEWDWIRTVAISPDGQMLAAADRERSIAFWELPTFKFLGRFQTGQRYITELEFSPNSHRIAAAGFDGTVQVIGLIRDTDGDLKGTLIHTLEHPSWVSDLAWLGDGEYLASISAVGEGTQAPATARGIFTWEMSTGLSASLPLVANGDTGTNRLVLTSDGILLSASFNGNIYAWANEADLPFAVAEHFYRRESNLFDNRTTDIPKGYFLAIASPNRSNTTDFIRAANLLLQEIPLEYRYYGTSFTSFGAEQFFYILQMRGREAVGVAIRIRNMKDLQANPVVDDFIGADAPVQSIEIGDISGELVQGEWTETSLDPEGVFRWTPSSRTRFRWVQGDQLIEVVSQSAEMSPEKQWQDILQPVVSAVIVGKRNLDAIRYIVRPGDTCSGIAERFGTSIEQITKDNELGDCNMLSIGQELLVRLGTTPEAITQADLNCDGVPEIIQRIPANEGLDGQPLNFGIILKALKSGDLQDISNYTSVWNYTLVNQDVDYFTEPILFSLPGDCQVLVAINGYGGGGREAGLSVFRWTGREMRLLLSSAGFLSSSLEDTDENGQLIIRTTRLTLNANLSSCIQTNVYYIWQNGKFTFYSQNATGKIDCLGNFP